MTDQSRVGPMVLDTTEIVTVSQLQSMFVCVVCMYILCVMCVCVYACVHMYVCVRMCVCVNNNK